eukprot:SAG22_NODE_14686_length_368_cov_0.587361_1_plen_74_part_10
MHLPDSFRDLLNVVAGLAGLLAFDVSAFGIGCLTRGLYLPSLIANVSMVGVVMRIVLVVYLVELKKARGSFTKT